MISEIIFYNLKDVGFWSNSSGFIFGMSLLVYALYKHPDSATNDDKGIVYGMLFLMPTIFVIFFITIRVRSLGLNTDQDVNSS